MTTENITDDLTPSGPVEKPETQEIDWKVKAEELEAKAAKLENDLKANAGRTRQARERDALIESLVDEVGGIRRATNALIARTASGDTEALTEDLAKIGQESERAKADRQYDQAFARIESRLEEALCDEDGALLVDIESPEGKELITAWTTARQAKNLADLSDVVLEANKLARKTERQRIKAAQEAERKAAKVGEHDLSVPSPAAGAGSGKTWAQAQQARKLTDISDDDYARLVSG